MSLDGRVIIAGSRHFAPAEADEHVLTAVALAVRAFGIEITEVVSGGARGIDAAGSRWAAANGIPLRVFEADWDGLGKAAGHIRNAAMADHADAAILIPHPTLESRGTLNMLEQMERRGKPWYRLVVPNGDA